LLAQGERELAVALGANLSGPLGDREDYIRAATLMASDRLGRLLRASHIYETDPIGPGQQRRYLNQVLLLAATETPEHLLERAFEIENELGRVREKRWGPRTIDLDLLLYGDCQRSTSELTLPHPRLHERAFVLMPLLELLPQWRHPVLGKTVRVLAAEQGSAGVRRFQTVDDAPEG
jgi:2-amino-4-hydroxy-6-hydroxymethyldihydropteridine diphosphokinase